MSDLVADNSGMPNDATKDKRTQAKEFQSHYSPFRLTLIIYAEKFEFENPTIMEDKQCKQT